MLKLLVFDLDGTLADTRLDLAESVNAALARVGRSPLPIATVVSFVGDGARNLITRSLMASGDGRPDAAEIDATLEAFLAHYQDHCLGATRAYAGVDAIRWPGGFCRRDIGWRALEREKKNKL